MWYARGQGENQAERVVGCTTCRVMAKPRVVPCGDAVGAHLRREAQQRVELDVPIARCNTHRRVQSELMHRRSTLTELVHVVVANRGIDVVCQQ